MNYVDLGLRIKRLRRQMQMTQAELAEKTDVSSSYIGHIERGTRAVSLDTLMRLCHVLQTDPNSLLSASLSVNHGGGAAHANEQQLRDLLAQAIAILSPHT